MTAPDDGVPDDRLADWHPAGGPETPRWSNGEVVPLLRLVGIHDKQKEVER